MRQPDSESDATEPPEAINRRSALKTLVGAGAGVAGGIGILGDRAVGTASAAGRETLSVTSNGGSPDYKIWVSDPNVNKEPSMFGDVTNHDGYSVLSGTVGENEHKYHFSDSGMLNTVDAVWVSNVPMENGISIVHRVTRTSLQERFLKVVGRENDGGNYELNTNTGRKPDVYADRESDEDFSGSTNPPDDPLQTSPEGSSWVSGRVSEGDTDLYEIYGDVTYMRFTGDVNALMSVNTPGSNIDFPS